MLILLQTFSLIVTSTLQAVEYQMEKLSLGGLRDLPKITQLVNKPTPLNPIPPQGLTIRALKGGGRGFSSLSTACPRGSLESICIPHSEEQLVPISLIPRIPLPCSGRTGLSLLVAGKAGAERDLGDSSATRLATQLQILA